MVVIIEITENIIRDTEMRKTLRSDIIVQRQIYQNRLIIKTGPVPRRIVILNETLKILDQQIKAKQVLSCKPVVRIRCKKIFKHNPILTLAVHHILCRDKSPHLFQMLLHLLCLLSRDSVRNPLPASWLFRQEPEVFHGSFFLGQIASERRNFRKTELLQLLYITLGGSVLNFFLYTVLGNVSFSLYPLRLVVCVLAFAVSAFGCTMVLETRLMRTPMEGCIQLLADRMGTTMGKLRQKIDVVLVIISVAITLIFGVEWTLREGTIIAALVFGPMMDFWKKTVFSR